MEDTKENTVVSTTHTCKRYNDSGQATVEYALVLLGAALVALLLIGWFTVGGGAARVGNFLGHIFDTIEEKAK
jgi:Flp pilus assembly pilin Flp